MGLELKRAKLEKKGKSWRMSQGGKRGQGEIADLTFHKKNRRHGSNPGWRR